MTKTGKVVYRGMAAGKPIVIRYPKMSDAKAALEFINKISREKSFLNIQGKQLNMKEERAFLKKNISGIKKKVCVHLFVLAGDRIVGSATMNRESIDAQKHKAEFGIVMAKDMRGYGIGRLLMSLVLKESERSMQGVKMFTLKVFANNPLAFRMYRKFGFKQFGILPKGVTHKGKPVDEIFMYKDL